MNLTKLDNVNQIVEGCINGDRKYQQELYRATYSNMLSLCMRYASNTDEAKDMLQDGFLKIFDNFKNYKNTGSVESWMAKVLVNNIIDCLRKKNKLFVSTSETIITSSVDDKDENDAMTHLKTLNAEKIISLIQALTPVYRTTFNLYVIEDYTHKEIAKMLNISEGTSKSNLAKAKRNLKKMFIEKYGNIYE